MTEFGKTLRAAREAKGLSVAQLAEMTHMTPARVEELEAENFASIPAAIYGRGFVRLYCGAVGLDPKPLADEFTDIFNGNRDPEIRERAPEPEPIPAAREDLAQSLGDTVQARREDPVSADDLFAEPPPADSLPPNAAPPQPCANPPPAPEPEAAPAAGHGPTLSRYAAPLHDRPKLAVPPSVWRLALLGCAALLVLWTLAVGVRALYRATGGAPGDIPETEAKPAEAASDAKPVSDVKPSGPAHSATEARTPQAIPALYID